MRLVDADELMEHVWREKLDSREFIANMIDNAPTVEEISTRIPIDVFKHLISLEPKTGRWIKIEPYPMMEHEYKCSECYNGTDNPFEKYCSECGAKMEIEDV